jgi:hypothetical protein
VGKENEQTRYHLELAHAAERLQAALSLEKALRSSNVPLGGRKEARHSVDLCTQLYRAALFRYVAFFRRAVLVYEEEQLSVRRLKNAQQASHRRSKS